VDKGDLLSLLLNARDTDDGTRMTDRQVRDEAMTLFLAGHETTALTLSWAWYLLARNPDAETKMIAEIAQILPGRVPEFADVARLRYTEAVLLEAMRLYPPAYVIGREALRDSTLGGYPVARGTTVLMSQWVVQRDARFFAEPEQFCPERWLGEAAKTVPKFAYFPFGGGPRLCVGNTFALMEMALVLATLAPRFHFTLEPGVDIAPLPAFTLHPVPGVPAVITPR
jgi:cytochrome P450